MTPQELISTLKQLHEDMVFEDAEGAFVCRLCHARSGLDKYENSLPIVHHSDCLSSELPRIIRLLEAGEMLRASLDDLRKFMANDEQLAEIINNYEGGYTPDSKEIAECAVDRAINQYDALAL